MTDYLTTGPLDDKDMDPGYRAAEEAYREQAARLWETAEELKREVRLNVEMSDEEREDLYMRRYLDRVEEPFNKLAGDFVASVAAPRGEAERALTEGVGEKFGEFVVSLSGKPADELKRVMKTAGRTGQGDLAAAAAQVALDGNLFGIFDEWAASDPKRAEAMRRVRTTPGPEQLATRAKALKPPRADASSLVPGEKEREAVAMKRAADDAAKEAFYNRPRSFSGRTVRHV